MMVLPGVRPGVRPGPDGWGLPPAPLPYEFLGWVVPYGPQVGAGEVGACFPSPPGGAGTLPGLTWSPAVRPDAGTARRPLATEKEMGQLAKRLRWKRKDPGVPAGPRGVRRGGSVGKGAEPDDHLPLGGPATEPRQQCGSCSRC